MSQSELACVYAALILHDDGLEISVRLNACGRMAYFDLMNDAVLVDGNTTSIELVAFTWHVYMQADNIQKLTSAANCKVEPYWPGLFAKLFANKNMDDLITNVGAGKLCDSAFTQAKSCSQYQLRYFIKLLRTAYADLVA